MNAWKDDMDVMQYRNHELCRNEFRQAWPRLEEKERQNWRAKFAASHARELAAVDKAFRS